MSYMDYPNGFEAIAPRHVPSRATLCVHFTGRGVEHEIRFAEAARDGEVARARAARLQIEWDDRTGMVLRGRVLLRGEVACDAFLLTSPTVGPGDSIVPTPVGDRALLRAAGLGREWATLVARMPERPLLCTVARGPEPSPQLLARIHSLLLTSARDAQVSPHAGS